MPEAWQSRVWREFRAGNLTRAGRDVLLTLRTFRGPGGIAWPAHATLAERAGCCVRTVQRALAAAAQLGLVTWRERRVRAGWRWLRTSSLYSFALPEEPVTPRPKAPRRTTGHGGRGGESESKKDVLAEMLRLAAAAPDLLAARRRAIEGKFA